MIARALAENPTEFPSPVKASLVDDVLSLAFVGSTSYDTAFNLINYLRNESQPEPWTALMRHAVKLNLVLYDTAIYPKYQVTFVLILSDVESLEWVTMYCEYLSRREFC